MRILNLLVRRLAALVLTLLISSFTIFAAVSIAPGDSAQRLAGRNATPEALAAVRAEYHLDQPFVAQYGHWVANAVQGDFGRSGSFQSDVSPLIADRLVTSFLLVSYAAVLIVGIGLAAGVVAAVRGGVVGKGITTVATVGMGAPSFAVAILLIWLFSSKLGWFPIYGGGSGFVDQLYHLTLPAISLAVGFIAYIARITRTAVVTELQSEHVSVARSRGLSWHHVLYRHVLRNAAPPVITLVGLTVAGLTAGTVVAEQAFGVSGIGSLLVEAAALQDVPVVLAISMIVVTAFVVINMVVDVLVARLDPRINKEEVR